MLSPSVRTKRWRARRSRLAAPFDAAQGDRDAKDAKEELGIFPAKAPRRKVKKKMISELSVFAPLREDYPSSISVES